MSKKFRSKKYKSHILMVIYKTMKDMYDAGVLDQAKFEEFQRDCLKKKYLKNLKMPLLLIKS